MKSPRKKFARNFVAKVNPLNGPKYNVSKSLFSGMNPSKINANFRSNGSRGVHTGSSHGQLNTDCAETVDRGEAAAAGPSNGGSRRGEPMEEFDGGPRLQIPSAGAELPPPPPPHQSFN